ncbi:MAG: VOC family protein [Gemmataceae bacterium]|nr:VOC family protein [Gemmataceae bacterium]
MGHADGVRHRRRGRRGGSAGVLRAGLRPGERFPHESGGYGELETGGTALAFAAHEVAGANLPGGYLRLAESAGLEAGLVTDDVAGAVARAVAAGAVLLAEPKAKPWGQTVACVRCPCGLLVEPCTPMG